VTVRYWEDFKVGERFSSRGITLTEDAIIEFGYRYDPQPFHVDKEAAVDSPYGGLIASGFHTATVTFRMFYQTGVIANSIGSPGIDELRWLKPVRPGDTLYAEAEVLETRASRSKPDRGSIKVAYSAVNQIGETVMTYICTQFIRRRPEEGVEV
jgi:acyl dehydratase